MCVMTTELLQESSSCWACRKFSFMLFQHLLEVRADIAASYFPRLVPLLLSGASDSSPALRQLAIYALSLAAKLAPQVRRATRRFHTSGCHHAFHSNTAVLFNAPANNALGTSFIILLYFYFHIRNLHLRYFSTHHHSPSLIQRLTTRPSPHANSLLFYMSVIISIFSLIFCTLHVRTTNHIYFKTSFWSSDSF